MASSFLHSFLDEAASLDENRELEDTTPVFDEEEFLGFYERTSRSLWAYLSRIIGSPQEADDVLQEAYYRFYRAGARHESEAHRRNSLFMIATNLVRDRARHAHRHPTVALSEEPLQALERPSLARADQQATAIARTDLARAMERMEPVQRKLLWLAYAQGATHVEIAQVLGLRAGSIRTTLLRARRKLARYLSSEQRADRR